MEESKNEIAVLKVQSEINNKGEEHGGESWENFKDKSVEIDSHNPANSLLFPEEPHGDISTEEHARRDFDSDSKEDLIPEHKAKAETKLTEDDNFTKAIKAFESYSSSCCEIKGAEQNRISEVVRTLKEIKMSQMNIVESSAVPTGITMDEAASTTEESVIFNNISIKERLIFKCSEIEEESSDEFGNEGCTLLISPADHDYWGTYEGLTDVSSSSPMSSVSSKAATKLIRTACDQHHSDLRIFCEPLSPEFYVNLEAANKQSCCFSSVKEIPKDIVSKVKNLGKKEKDHMNMISLNVDELRRKLEEHLENEKRKLDKLKQKEKPKWKPWSGCCKQDDVVANHKRKISSKSYKDRVS